MITAATVEALVEAGYDTVPSLAKAASASEDEVARTCTEMVDIGWLWRVPDGQGSTRFEVAARGAA